MNQHLPVISGSALVRHLERAGWTVARQKGSHVIMRRDGASGIVVVPLHSPLKRGTLAAILRDTGIAADELRGWPH